MTAQIIDLVTAASNNLHFRHVLATMPHSQLVVMNLISGEDIGSEVHQLDQFIYIVSGTGKAVLDNVESDVTAGSAILIPHGALHNIINTGEAAMKLFTIYSPAEHADGTIHQTKAEATAAEAQEHS